MKRMIELSNEKSITTNMQYTKEWFHSNHDFDSEDLKAIKDRLEHLPKMMDVLNELLKNGDKDADVFARRMSNYVQGTLNAIESDYQYIAWGRADEMVTY